MSKIKPFDVILIDPPWPFKVWEPNTGSGRSAERHYKGGTMTLDDIYHLDLQSVMAKNAAVALWVPWPLMLSAPAMCFAFWGVTYRTRLFTWAKLNQKGEGFFMGNGYYGRCVPGSSRIYILDNTTGVVEKVSIATLENKDLSTTRIWSHAGWKRIDSFYRNRTDVAAIQTGIGTTFSSWNHRWASKALSLPRFGTKRVREHRVDYRSLDEIKRLKFERHAGMTGGGSVNLLFSTRPIESNMPIGISNGYSLTDDIGWMIGLFVAEGNYATKTGDEQIRFTLHKKEKDFVDRIASTVNRLGVVHERFTNSLVSVKSYASKSANSVAVYFSSSSIKSLFQAFVLGRGAHGKRLNLPLLLQTSSDFRFSFLDGILSGDGTKGDYGYNGYSDISLCNDDLIGDISELCHSLGIMTRRWTPRMGTASNGTRSMTYRLKLACPRNKDLSLDGQPVFPVEIKSIEDFRNMETFDITVEGHAFIVDDLISHNSNDEVCLLAARGSLPRTDKGVRSLIAAELEDDFEPRTSDVPAQIVTRRGRHSEKPAESHERIERLWPEAHKLELFARQKRPGWTALGDEITGRDIRDDLALLAKRIER